MAHKSTNTNASSAMAQLLAKHKNDIVTLKKGESVKGKITKLAPKEVLVDVGAKTQALVLEKEKHIMQTIISMFKVGETVEVNVLNPESEYGQPIVSLRRFIGQLAWDKLEGLQKSKEPIEIMITESTKAGYLANTDFGVSGFLPNSQSQPDTVAGKRVSAFISEINRKDNKIIFSQKPALTEEEFAKLMKQYKVGEKVSVNIIAITAFGLFVSLPITDAKNKDAAVEGFIHISEIAWEKVTDLNSLYTVGESIEAVIIRFDADAQKINLSVKRLTTDPFEALLEQYPVEKKVKGTVIKVEEAGVTIELAEDATGMIKKDKVPPGTTYTVGQTVTVTVSEHDKKRHKISLVPVLLEKPIGYR